MAAQASPITDPASRARRSMRLDPARHPVPDDVPQSMLDNWQAMLDAAAAERRALQDNFDIRLLAQKEYARKLRDITLDASMIHMDLSALAYLFLNALMADDPGESSDLNRASHLVVDVMKTMATRLAAMEDRACLAYQEANP